MAEIRIERKRRSLGWLWLLLALLLVAALAWYFLSPGRPAPAPAAAPPTTGAIDREGHPAHGVFAAGWRAAEGRLELGGSSYGTEG